VAPNYFHENHFKSGFDEFFSPFSDSAHFHYITLGKLMRWPLLPYEEAKLAAKLISQKLTQPVLCLSGGLDSEAMALAFLGAEVKFSAAIMNLDNGLNEYDISVAREFCIRNNISFEEIHIPARKILQTGEHLEVAEQYRTNSPERALFILFLQKIRGEPVIGGEILRRETVGSATNFFCPKDRDLSYWRYLAENKRNGVPYFHYYTPELALSFMAHTSIAAPKNESIDWKGKHREFYLHKFNVYREGGFPMQEDGNRKQKWHGFEGLKINFDSEHTSQNAYTRAFRDPLESEPVYDKNQVLLIEETDEIAHKILEPKVNL
jgi:hypothetical protein